MSKKMMIKPSYLLMGVFAFLFLISCASALNSPDWREYSPQYTYVTNTQDPNAQGFLDLNSSVTTGILSYGGIASWYSFYSTQLTTKAMGTTQYLAMTDDGNLTIYTKTLTPLSYVRSGNQIGSLSLLGEGNILKIAGIFINNSQYIFQIYDYNIISNVLSLNVSASIGGDVIASIKCLEDGSLYYNYNGVVCFGISGAGGQATSWSFRAFLGNGSVITKSISSGGVYSYLPRAISILDANNDGQLEFLALNDWYQWYFNQNGTTIFRRSSGGKGNSDIVFFKVGTTTERHFFWWLFGETELAPSYKIAVTLGDWGSSPSGYLTYLNLDGTLYNGVSNLLISSRSGLNSLAFGSMSVLDWNNDGFDEIAVPYSFASGSSFIKMYNVTGNIVKSGSFPVVNIFFSYPTNNQFHGGHVISAKLNGDNYYDFIFNPVISSNSKMYLFDLQNNITILNSSGNFIPVDFNSDGALELLGANSTRLTLITSSSYTNQNAVLNTLTFLPSTSPAVYSPMTITIGATDQENDFLHYKVDCGNGVITETISNTRQCTYASTGDAYLTAYVRDQYHVTYDSYSQTINVGAVSNETEITQPDENTTTILATNGGMTLPTQLVNPDNFNQGLLPEIYFGTLAFFSSILSPTIILVMVIFFALIMVTIGMIIKKIAGKVADMSSR